jgi:hypothetical protein
MWLICCCFLNESRPFGRSGGNNEGLRVIEESFRRLVDGRGSTIGRWRWRRIGSVMVVLASFSVFYAWRDFRLDELWVENSFMSERSQCRETPNCYATRSNKIL